MEQYRFIWTDSLHSGFCCYPGYAYGLIRRKEIKRLGLAMDQTLFIFLELLGVFFFIYSLEKDSWECLLIFLATALFFALSLASFDIEKTFVIGETTVTKSYFDEAYGYLNSGLGLLTLAIGFIRTLNYKESLNPEID